MRAKNDPVQKAVESAFAFCGISQIHHLQIIIPIVMFDGLLLRVVFVITLN